MSGQLSTTQLVLLVVFCLITLVYLVLFYVGSGPQSAQRQSALAFIFAPDSLFLMWCGGKLENFSILDRWPIALISLVILGAAWLAGRLLLLLLGVAPALDKLERFAFATGVGLNVLSLFALAVGVAGRLQSRWPFVTLLIALLIANAATWLRRSSNSPPIDVLDSSPPEQAKDVDPRWHWWLLAALPFAAVIILGGMLPPAAYDVREYHLQAPKEWYQNGRIDFLPHNIYANMPLGSELTSLWAMALIGGEDAWWWGALTGKTVMACYSLITAAALLALGRRIHSPAAGVVAAVLYLSTPWIVELAKTGYNEGPVALYALLAIYALWHAEHSARPALSWRFIALAGFCAGSAVACKYPPALFLVIPLLLWIAAHWSLVIGHWSFANLRTSLFHASLFLLAVLAASGLWFGKNVALTHNPTYPLLYSLFDGRTRTPEKDRQWTRVHSPQPDQYGNRFSLRDLANQISWLLWRTQWAAAAIVPLAAFAWLPQRDRGFIAAVAVWMLFAFTAWWLITHRLDRFLMLLMPFASLLAALGALALPHRAWRVATLSLLAAALIAQFPLIAITSDNRFFAPLEALRRDDPDLGYEGGRRLHPAHRWLNEHAQPGQRVLLVGDAEPFELKIPAVYNTCFDDCQFTRIFQGRSRADRLQTLQQEKIAFVFFHWPHLTRFRSPGNYGYTSDYPTPQLVHDELVAQQALLKKVDIKLPADPSQSLPAELGELFQVAPD
jgi:hypothetical protein